MRFLTDSSDQEDAGDLSFKMMLYIGGAIIVASLIFGGILYCVMYCCKVTEEPIEQ